LIPELEIETITPILEVWKVMTELEIEETTPELEIKRTYRQYD